MLEQATSVVAGYAGAGGAHAPRSAPRLLVIDDDHLHRLIIRRIAGKAGYLSTEAASYEAAAKLAEEAVFDCITLDLLLGEHAGVEMLRHLWQLGCKAPIIIISGCDPTIAQETAHFARSLKLNIRESVPKPVDLALLRYSLERLRAQREDASAAHDIIRQHAA
jgi:two-component system, chemotaxis family, chemotaxis protein CheY